MPGRAPAQVVQDIDLKGVRAVNRFRKAMHGFQCPVWVALAASV